MRPKIMFLVTFCSKFYALYGSSQFFAIPKSGSSVFEI